ELIDNACETSGSAISRASECAWRIVGRPGHVVDLVAIIDCREHPARRVWGVLDYGSARISHRSHRAVEVVGITHALGYTRNCAAFSHHPPQNVISVGRRTGL